MVEGHVTQARVDETSLRLARLDASLAEAEAAIASLEVRLAKAVITAPFDGRVVSRQLDSGAVAGPGAPVLTLLETAPARFQVALDPALAARLEPGAEVVIETSQGRLPARLSDLAPDLDAATRSQMAFFDLAPGTAAPLARSTGDLILQETRVERGAWVPLSALRQGPRGAWTLLVVDDGNRIAVEAAEILHLAQDRAYLRGTFDDGARYLPGGTHRVVPGEIVALAEAE